MSSPLILTCSEESFKMYNALCKNDEEREDDTRLKKVKIFYSRTPAIFLSATIGIINEKSIEIKKDRQLTRREYILGNPNYDVIKKIIKIKHGLKTEHDIVIKLMEYAEYGINELYQEYHKTGEIDFNRISRQAKSG